MQEELTSEKAWKEMRKFWLELIEEIEEENNKEKEFIKDVNSDD